MSFIPFLKGNLTISTHISNSLKKFYSFQIRTHKNGVYPLFELLLDVVVDVLAGGLDGEGPRLEVQVCSITVQIDLCNHKYHSLL